MIRRIPFGAGRAICARWQIRTTITVKTRLAANTASGNQISNRRHHGLAASATRSGRGSGFRAGSSLGCWVTSRTRVSRLVRAHLGSPPRLPAGLERSA
jgi:hypothetical protein